MPAEAAPAGFGAYPAPPAPPAAPAYAPPAPAQPYTPPWTPPTPATPAPWSPPPQPAVQVPWAQPQPPPVAPQPVAPLAARPAQRGRNVWNFDDPTGAFMVEDVEVRNKTEATVVVRPVGSGALVVIKQRFFANRRGELAMVPGATIQEADEAHADMIGTSLRVPSDFAGQKAGTDVVVLGDAIAPRGGARRVDVRVRVGPAQRLLAVFGMRTWHKGRFLGGLKLTEPTPFDRCPLRWELAFGGGDDPLNPVGVGRAASLENTLAPRVEDPSALLADERSRPLPSGVAPIAADWPTRGRCQPGDPRREHSAAPGLTTQGYLQGGEPFEFVGMHEDGELRGCCRDTACSWSTGRPRRRRRLVQCWMGSWSSPNERVFFLTWRLHLPTVEDLRSVRVTESTSP
ncbi:MAG: DUF2169 domain-containing protein [Myxococcales bacterium]|nr:DUF2169 domain-containing protein [Myxococcales bacterium]